MPALSFRCSDVKSQLPTSGKVILVVEDEFLIAMELESMLEGGGYKVLGPATTVAAALAFLAHHRPDACVLDFNLRGEHVTPVARVLKAEGVPFLLSSAYEQVKFDGDAAFNGAINIGKPASREHLFATLDMILKT
jgi:two-component system, response regulator PdtaR